MGVSREKGKTDKINKRKREIQKEEEKEGEKKEEER
jgi:hypothetical protein